MVTLPSPARTVAAVCIAATLAVIGCGGDEPRPPAPGAPPPPVGDLQPEPDRHPEPLRDETPDEIPAPVLEGGRDANERNDERLTTDPQPVGGAQNYSCRKDFSGRVYSARGVRPMLWVNHYTVSPNRPGWGDVLGIHSYFKRTRVASSTFILDFEGHCLQMVPLEGKPWTQGAMNPVSTSVEIIATGRAPRSAWLNAPIFRRGILADLARDTMRRQGIPLRRGVAPGCAVRVS